MTTPWTIAFIALSIVVATMAVLLLGLIRRVTDVLSQVEALLSSGMPGHRGHQGGLHIGDTAPPLPNMPNMPAEPTSTDETVRLVVFLEAGCEPCQVLVNDIRRRRFNATPNHAIAVLDHAEAFNDPLPPGWTVLSDVEHRLFNAWQVTGTPTAFTIDRHHTIRDRDFANTTKDLHRLLQQAAHQGAEPHPAAPLDHPMEMSHHDH